MVIPGYLAVSALKKPWREVEVVLLPAEPCQCAPKAVLSSTSRSIHLKAISSARANQRKCIRVLLAGSYQLLGNTSHPGHGSLPVV